MFWPIWDRFVQSHESFVPKHLSWQQTTDTWGPRASVMQSGFLKRRSSSILIDFVTEISMNKIEIFTVVICLRRHIRRDDLLMFSPPDLMGQNKNGSEELNNEHLWINSSMQISSF